jgi:hypothetical protein
MRLKLQQPDEQPLFSELHNVSRNPGKAYLSALAWYSAMW